MSDLTIKKIQTVPSTYATLDGTISIEVTGGKKPYKYSSDNGIKYSPNQMLNVYGGTHIVVVKDANGDTTKPITVTVQKTLSEVQADYLNMLFDVFGNESKAAMQTITKKGKTVKENEYLALRVAKLWKADPDFAELVSKIKLEADEYYKDWAEHQLTRHIEGGMPIFKYFPIAVDENGKIDPKNVETVKVQVGETLPNLPALTFLLERKYKDDYSARKEITGANGGRIVALVLDSEFDGEEDALNDELEQEQEQIEIEQLEKE